MRLAAACSLVVSLVLVACGDPPAPRPYTPRWAYQPWISKDISDRADTEAFVAGFRERDIPVGVVVLDSPWETHYNTFIPNPDRYPDFGGLVANLRADGIRTVLWVTQFVNQASFDLEEGGDEYDGPSPNFQAGLDDGFFVNGGRTYEWWKGIGASVDFFNPAAMRWWHAQQDAVLDLGIAGWKLDFGDSYVLGDTVETAAGVVPHQAYSEAYYRDFLAYGREKRGRDEFVTMVRPYDESYQFPGRFFATKEDCPVGWVGDNRRDWVGLVDALDHLFRSAQAGYLVIGSDIGGYLDRDDKDVAGSFIPFDTENFLRWTALGALTPFMQLHGRANITPWTVPERVEETVAAYRWWSWLHVELVPFWDSLAGTGATSGTPIMRPIGDGPAEWAGDWRYQLGEAFLVAPILDATGVRDVVLPAGARWLDFWNPAAEPLAGGTTLTAFDVGSSARIPLFLREGAIVPMEISRAYTGLGDEHSAGHLTVLAWPGETETTFELVEEDRSTTRIAIRSDKDVASFRIDRATKPLLVRLRTGTEPTKVTSGWSTLERRTPAELATATSGWTWDPAWRSAVVKVPASGWGVELKAVR